ncbi:hypothetical protein Q4595_16940, partial [Wenyingzhuangia sp. 1_MG-2023]|nr:hypothetical protein [Wenyingzhuangia sp. 1_MG-2023]
MSNDLITRLTRRLQKIYLDATVAADTAADLERLCLKFLEGRKSQPGEMTNGQRWSQEDVILITYGNSIQQAGEVPFQTLSRFLKDNVADTLNAVHLLPFSPYSSDDGFSVIDYRQVNPDWGNWEDVASIA